MPQPLTVSYATPTGQQVVPTLHAAGVCAAALVVGLLTANPFAEAVGFSPISDATSQPGTVFAHIACGMVMALAGGTAAVFVYRLLIWLRAALSATNRRPEKSIVITLLIVGVVCVIAALLIPICFGSSLLSIGALLGDVIAILTFILGATVIAIGIWGSLGERAVQAPPSPAAPLPVLPTQDDDRSVAANLEHITT